MRKIKFVVSFVILFLLFLNLTVQATEPRILRVTTWGGRFQEIYNETVHLFEEENNCKVEWVIGDEDTFMINARKGEVDVVTNDDFHAIAGEMEGLWAELDEEKIPNLANVYDSAKISKYTVMSNFAEQLIAYNEKYVKPVPTSWDVFWDPAYKGRVILAAFTSSTTLALMQMQAEKRGGSVDNIDPGFERMVELSKSGNLLGCIQGNSERVSLLQSEEAWLTPFNPGRVKSLWDKGATFIKMARPIEGCPPMVTTVNVVKTTKELDLAMRFINYVLSPECQENFAIRNYYSPTIKNVKIPPEIEPFVLKDMTKLYIPDFAAMIKNKEEWNERWSKAIGK